MHFKKSGPEILLRDCDSTFFMMDEKVWMLDPMSDMVVDLEDFVVYQTLSLPNREVTPLSLEKFSISIEGV